MLGVTVFEMDVYISKADDATSVDQLFNVFSGAMAENGYDVLSLQFLTVGPGGEPVTIVLPFSGRAESQSSAGNAAPHSIATFARGQEGAFHYSRSKNTIAEAEGLDPADTGICIPLRGASGSFAIIIANYLNPKRAPMLSTLRVIEAMAAVFYIIYRSIDLNIYKDVQLTGRESEVLKLVSIGETKKSIADVIGVSSHAVDFHYRNIMKKYQTRKMVVAAVRAVRSGVI